MSDTQKPLAIIGRERYLIDELSKALAKMFYGPPASKKTLAVIGRHAATALGPTRRGCSFEVHLQDDKLKPTGHVVKVTVELDRFEEQR